MRKELSLVCISSYFIFNPLDLERIKNLNKLKTLLNFSLKKRTKVRDDIILSTNYATNWATINRNFYINCGEYPKVTIPVTCTRQGYVRDAYSQKMAKPISELYRAIVIIFQLSLQFPQGSHQYQNYQKIDEGQLDQGD